MGLFFPPFFFFPALSQLHRAMSSQKIASPSLEVKPWGEMNALHLGKCRVLVWALRRGLCWFCLSYFSSFYLLPFVTRCDGTPETACLLLMLPLQQNVWNEALKVPKTFRVKFVHQGRLLAEDELSTRVGGVHKSSDAAKAWGQLEGWGFRK